MNEEDLHDYLTAILIQNQRIYDILMVIAGATDYEKAEYIAQRHEQGDFLAPEPRNIA